jgi:hypothetical protein
MSSMCIKAPPPGGPPGPERAVKKPGPCLRDASGYGNGTCFKFDNSVSAAGFLGLARPWAGEGGGPSSVGALKKLQGSIGES